MRFSTLAARCKIRTRTTKGLLCRILRCETLKMHAFPVVSRLDFDQESSFSSSRAFCNGLLVLSLLVAPAALAHPGGSHEHPPAIEHTLTGEQRPWTSDTPRFAPKDFQFVVVSDNTGTPRPGVFREAMEKAELLQPAFVISVGDLIDGYVDTKAELHAQWDEFMTYLDPLSVPFFFAPGNHDVGRQLWHDVYRERVGPTYYYFLYQDVLFLILDSNDAENKGTGYSEAQLAWAKGVLDKHPDVRWTFVFQHKPFWYYEKDWWAMAEPLFEGRKHTFFAGHVHNYSQEIRGNIQYVTLGTSGGGTRLRGKDYGEFDHVMWVTVTDEGPKMAALALDGILPADFRTAELAEQLKSFRDEEAVRSTPVTLEAGALDSAAWEVSVTNPWDKPLRFKGFVEGNDALSVSPSSIGFTVPPDSTITKTIRVTAEPALPMAAFQPLALHWTGVYDAFNAPPVQFSDVLRLHAGGQATIPRRDGIALDGKLDDWASLPYEMRQPGDIYTNELSWKGPEDARLRFGLAHDGTKLYVAMEVEDDAIDGGGVKLWQDFGAVFFRALGPDPEQPPARSAAVAIVDGPDITPGERAGYERSNAEQPSAAHGGESAVHVGDGRLHYEFSIPLASLAAAAGTTLEFIQINLGINDYDPADARLGISFLTWQPSWTRSSYAPTLGLFTLAP